MIKEECKYCVRIMNYEEKIIPELNYSASCMSRHLISAVMKQPELMNHKDVIDALSLGLYTCSDMGLFDVSHLKEFLEAGYMDFALRYPNVCPEFQRKFESAIIKIRQDYADGINKSEYQEEVIRLADGWILEFDEEILLPSENWYIAYGSNMSEAQMHERCPGAKLVGIGVVTAKKLEFYLHATLIDTDYETDEVPVAVWRITPEDEANLDRYEGVNGGYGVKGGYYYKDQTVAMLNNGIQVLGLIYLMDKIRPQPVTDRYYNGIAAAYDSLGLHDKIAEVLEPARERSLKL